MNFGRYGCLADFVSVFSGFGLLAFSTYTPVALGLLFEGREHNPVTHNGERLLG